LTTKNKNQIFLSTSLLLSFLLIISVVVFSCKTKEKIHHRIVLIDRSPRFLFENLKENEFKYDWVTAKFSTIVTSANGSNSFNATLKARKDSIIWMSISPAFGIEVARIKITKDTVRFINRINSTYFEGDFQVINKMFNVDFDFDMLQAILVGNAFPEFEADDFKSFIDKERYLLSTIRKRKLRKTIQKHDSLNLVVNSIWLEPKTFKISKYMYRDFNINRVFEANYSEFTKVDSLSFPFKIDIKLSGEKSAEIIIQYSKVVKDKLQPLPYSVPEKYEKMEK